MVRMALLLALAPVLCAQVLTVDASGERVWLAANWHRAGIPAEGDNFIYRRDPDGSWTELAHGFVFGAVFAPHVTADGGIVVWRRAFPCRMCTVPPPSEIEGLDRPLRIPLVLIAFSPNGRYAVTPGAWGLTEYQIEDRARGIVYKPSSGNAPDLVLGGFNPASVADDGTVLGAARDGRLVRWRPGGREELVAEGSRELGNWGLSGDGHRAWTVNTQGALTWFDLQSRARVDLGGKQVLGVRMSADGRRLAWRDGQAAFFWSAAGGVPAQAVFNDPEDRVADLALDGAGRFAWLFTDQGRLLRADLESGTRETILAELPGYPRQLNTGVPGSALLLEGPGITPDLEVWYGTDRLPIVDHGRNALTVQVPWELRVTRGQPLILRRPGHPFEHRQTGFVESGIVPQLARASDLGDLKAAHEGFRALVTRDDPAPAGGLIHTWMFGLGPVDQPLRTGEPGPRDPPARPLVPLACYLHGELFDPPAVGLELPFAAYAPGLIGAYQVDMRIPAGWPAGRFVVSCEANGRYTSAVLPVAR